MAEIEAQMLEYARRLNDIAVDVELAQGGLGGAANASDLRRIAQQIAAPPKPAPDAMREALVINADDPVATICKVLCQSKIFETGQGTCALVCMDQLGSPRKKGCYHAQRVHDKLALSILEALAANLLCSTPPPDDVRSALADAIESANLVTLHHWNAQMGWNDDTELTSEDQDSIIAALRSAPVSAPVVGVTREAIQTIIKLAISDGEWLGSHTLEPSETIRIRGLAIKVRTDSIESAIALRSKAARIQAVVHTGTDPCGSSVQDRLGNIMTWLREPDCIEEASVEWLKGWMDRRPITELGMVAALIAVKSSPQANVEPLP